MKDAGALIVDHPIEKPREQGSAPLEAILCTRALQQRSWRSPDYEKENRALVKLMSALADSPRSMTVSVPLFTNNGNHREPPRPIVG